MPVEILKFNLFLKYFSWNFAVEWPKFCDLFVSGLESRALTSFVRKGFSQTRKSGKIQNLFHNSAKIYLFGSVHIKVKTRKPNIV